MTHSGLLITWANADASISGHHVFDHGDLFSRCGIGAVLGRVMIIYYSAVDEFEFWRSWLPYEPFYWGA